MRIQRSVTSITWIPSEAMTGPMRLPMDMGLGHYDPAPPESVSEADLDALHAEDRFRFANRLQAWIEVEDGEITASGYDSKVMVGSTTLNLGVGKVSVPAVAYPTIQSEPQERKRSITFQQTAGGRTGAPFPHRIDRPPFVRLTAPTAWTTLSIELGSDGSYSFDVVGASPFPRHWIYDDAGNLVKKTGVIDFTEWTRKHDRDRTPWADQEHAALVSDVESDIERRLSSILMGERPEIRRLRQGETLIQQGSESTVVYLVLDGMFVVDVDGETVAEVGPGAVVGERSALEGGVRTSTVTSLTPSCVAAVPAGALPQSELIEVSKIHRREDEIV